VANKTGGAGGTAPLPASVVELETAALAKIRVS
jgi:hypothetical protein